MTHPSDITNGASLEDCHTNFFALADLNGIRWRKLISDVICIDPIEDPVLQSYSQCLSAGILSVWRRISGQRSNGMHSLHETNTLSYQKELWIFWYGNEPDFSKVVESSLSEAEQGSWEVGLSYECRTLLFKALHNLIERHLLSRGYTRLGRFFLEPQTIPACKNRKQIAFALHFFIHGESTVCASADARCTSSIYLLDKCHVTMAQTGQKNVKVILSPFGLEGQLTGVGYKYNDPSMPRFLNTWHRFYPHPCRKSRQPMDTEVPNIVEVLVGGLRMKYPTTYVLVTEEDHREMFPEQQQQFMECVRSCIRNISKNNVVPSTGLLTPPMSPAENFCVGDYSRTVQDSHKESFVIGGSSNVPQILRSSVNQEVALLPNKSNDLWDYQELTTDVSTCEKKHSKVWQRFAGASTGLNGASDGTNSKNFATAEMSHIVTRQRMPFHQRRPEPSIPEESHHPPRSSSSKNPTSSGADFKGFSVTGALPQLQTPFSQLVKKETTSGGEVYSSHSSSSDPIMPTLSPQPPLAKDMFSQDSADGATRDASSQFVVLKGKVTEEHLTPFHTSLLNSFEAKINEESILLMKTDNDQAENGCAVLPSEERVPAAGEALEKPKLSKRLHEEMEENRSTMSGPLYDYRHFTTPMWQHPNAKRPCLSSLPNAPYTDEPSDAAADCDNERNGYEFDGDSVPSTPRDPYEFTEFDETTPSGRGFRIKIEKEEKFILPNFPSPMSIPTPITPIPDIPAPSSEEAELSPANSKPSSGPKFIREEDLAVSLHDLDNIFDTSSSEEDNAEVPATPTRLLSSFDEYSGKIELSRMYPTPPSLEHNAVPSPFGLPVGTDCCAMTDCDALKEDYEDQEHSQLFHVEMDEVNVWNPPLIHTFLESSRFDALHTGYNSANNQELLYKSSWLNSKKHSPEISTPAVENQQFFNQSPAFDEQMSNFYSQDGHLDSRLILPNCEAVSPASSTPSYLNRNLNSIDTNSSLPVPEVHPLIVNLLLSDSMLNIFKDHNFDCCCLCVCNMNIRGSDAGINLPNGMIPTWNDEPQYKCTCGFSAVVHRHKSYNSGLFYEDEMEVAGMSSDNSSTGPKSSVTLDVVPGHLLELLKIQCKASASPFSVFHKFRLTDWKEGGSARESVELVDGHEVCSMALEEAKTYADNLMPFKLDESGKSSCLHKWPYMSSPLPASSHEVLLHLDSLKPLLQSAVHKKNNQRLWDITYVVSGPLTWREFHRLAARGTEDQCEPQPLPTLLGGFDGEMAAFSPFALNSWHKLCLEPYSLARDVAYIVVAPDSKLLYIKSFFRELSCTYESHNFGRHRPITKVLRDGIMRVGKMAASKVAEEPLSKWFNTLGNGDVANKLRIYARICKHRLAPHLATLTLDNSLFDPSTDTKSSTQSCFTDNADRPSTPKYTDNGEHPPVESQSQSSSSSMQESMEDDCHSVPALVIYVVDPIIKESDPSVQRMVTLGLIQSYAEMFSTLPEPIRNSIHLQLIDLNSVMEKTDKSRWKDQMKSLAFSVYSQSYETCVQRPVVKSLTGFGPAAARDAFLTKNNKLHLVNSVFKRPYVLASLKDKQKELGEMFGDRGEEASILYCTYCLTKDRKYILTCCTNDKGDFLETNIINIGIPNRHRRKQVSVRRFGLRKLLDFILELISSSIHPWRIIVDRFGRLGHGELKAWASLFSRRSLHAYSKKLRELCNQCSISSLGDTPSILSACLVSFGPDSTLRIMSDQFTFDDRFSSGRAKKSNLSTPEDATCTHILVFPTSATTQSSQATFQQEHIDPLPGGLGDDLLDALEDDDIPTGDINDLFRWTDSPPSGGNSPHRDPHSQPSSPGASSYKMSSFLTHGTLNRCESLLSESQDETLQLLQQPLALGYYVSTAKTGSLPRWFWSSCPQLQNTSPIFMKSALLIHVPLIQQTSDDLLHSQQQLICHPLDSNITSDVLRYVLEGYNALSWLSLDSDFRDRRSCLPVHMQTLMQLYGLVEAIL